MKNTTLKFNFDYKSSFVFGLCLGFIGFLLIYGFQLVDVTYDGWLLNSSQTEGLWDLSQHYQGWRAFRHSPWQFPFGLTEGLYDKPISVAYTDSIPLLAIIFKLFSPLLPETFQYFGIFGLLCYGLMGGFGALIARKASGNPLYLLLGSIFFIINPVLLKRMFYHTALAAHFLIPATICLWLYRDTIQRITYIIYAGILGLLSISINPYFLPMVLGILGLCCFQEFMEKKQFLSFLPLALSILVSLLTGWIIGLFYGNVPSSAEGLQRLSFNLNQFFNPGNPLLEITDYNYNWSIQNYSLLLPTLSLASSWQEEGFSYLGAGMILLVLISLCIRKTIDKKIHPSYIISCVLGIVIYLVLALSPTITLGKATLFSWNPPEGILQLLSIFRSTGRLIWPLYYGIITITILTIGTAFKQHSKNHLLGFVFCIALCLQLLDLSPALSYKHQAYHNYLSYESPLQNSQWATLGKTSNRICFYTGSHLGLYCNPQLSCIFEEYAYRYNLRMNLSYLSRDVSNAADLTTQKEFQSRACGQCSSDTIYIFYDFSDLPDETTYHLTYFTLDGYTIGVDNEHPIVKNK